MEKFEWTAFDIGMSMTFIGVCMAIFQGFAVAPAIRWLGDNRAVIVGFALFVVSFIGFAFATAGWQMYAWTVVFAMGSISGPAMTAILSTRLPVNEQGELQGALTALRSITACFGPLTMTWLFSYFTSPVAPVQFAGAPFFVASVLTIGGLFVVIRTLRGAT
jgi:DHA1 family tetracycline resistance protein-like MFS transporter